MHPFSTVDANTGKSFLNSMVVFITGTPIIDAVEDFQITYHDKKERCLPEADACFNRLILSNVSETYEEFKKNFIVSLSSGAQGFGRF